MLSRAQALEAGVTRRQIDRLLAGGEWRRVHPGVYRHTSVVPSPEGCVRAAALWLGERAVLTGAGAAWWWEVLPEAPARWQFVVSRHRPPTDDLRLVVGFVDPLEQTVRREVRVVSRPLAVLRAAAELEVGQPGRGIALVDRAKQRRLVSARDLEQSSARHRGTWGSREMRRLLDRTGDDAHSALERLAVRLLRQAGVRGFVLNHRTTLRSGRRVELDLAFPDRKVAIELDGYAFHSGPEAHQADVARANEVMADGWTLRRFTYRDLVSDPDGFVRAVLEVLAV